MKKTVPLKLNFNRVFRTYLGGALIDKFRNEEQKDTYYPEDWLASVVVAKNPPHDGETEFEGLSSVVGTNEFLRDLIADDPEAYLGKKHYENHGADFGVLSKFLDSAEKLPVQVHPTKKFALEFLNSPYGKTESWYILDGREINGEKPFVYMGFKEGVTRESWKDAFDRQDIKAMDDSLNKVYVNKGDVFLVTGGTPHAIGPGCFLLEVQEPTDYTISMERQNAAGIPNPDEMVHMGLGFERMFDCFTYDNYTVDSIKAKFKLTPRVVEDDENHTKLNMITYNDTTCFALDKIVVKNEYLRKCTDIPSCFAITEGEAVFMYDGIELPVKRGDCLFIPATCTDFSIIGKVEILECLPPQ